MSNITLLGAILILAVSSPAFADTPASSDESPKHKDAMAKCEKKAREHKVSEEEMQSYLDKCVAKHMKKEHADDASRDKKSTDGE